jgi:2,3-bisphosphoglycerate-dependent phosphoglycerate mutase
LIFQLIHINPLFSWNTLTPAISHRMKLFFTRHGESQANILRIISNRDLIHPLTGKGRLQAAALAEKLHGNSIARVYSSPITRAGETGQILSTSLGVPMEYEPALREPDCGRLEGRGDPDAWAEHAYWLDTWLAGRDRDKGPRGGDTYDTARGRFTSFIDKLIAVYGRISTEFVLVTHGELLLFGLPGLVTGLSTRSLLDRSLGYTVLIATELQAGKLVYLARESE